jgi:hypothetical protein
MRSLRHDPFLSLGSKIMALHSVGMTAEGSSSGRAMGMGVGCLVFVPSVFLRSYANFGPRTERAWWKKELESGLGLLPSITDLRVEVTGISQRMPPHSDILSSPIDYDIDYSVGPSVHSYITFTVTIPKRMHANFIGHREVNSERFKVTTFYGYHGPATFVRSTDGQDKRPSTYLVLVREFLKSELTRLETDLTVQRTGPSPFWADVFLRPSGTATDLSVDWTENLNSYDDVVIYYNPESEPEKAYSTVTELLREPFSIYYYHVRARNRRFERANIVATMTDELIAVHSRNGIRGWFRKILRSGGLARELLLAAITAKQLDVENRAQMQNDLGAVDSKDELPRLDLPVLTALCEHESNASFVDQLTMGQEVANTLEGGRMNQYEVFVISVATLLGGIAGGVVALIAK